MAEDAELVERLADLSHEQWRGWLRYMLPRMTQENLARWQRQMETPYANLPENEKDSDRVEARRMLAVVVGWLAELVAQERAEG